MRFSVSPDHITRGRRLNSCSCPLSLAIAEALPGARVWVSADEIFIYHRGRARVIPTPEVAAEFVTAFDAGRAVGPFEVELPILAA